MLLLQVRVLEEKEKAHIIWAQRETREGRAVFLLLSVIKRPMSFPPANDNLLVVVAKRRKCISLWLVR